MLIPFEDGLVLEAFEYEEVTNLLKLVVGGSRLDFRFEGTLCPSMGFMAKDES